MINNSTNVRVDLFKSLNGKRSNISHFLQLKYEDFLFLCFIWFVCMFCCWPSPWPQGPEPVKSSLEPSLYVHVIWQKHVYYFPQKLEASFMNNQLFNFTIMRMKNSSLTWGGHHMRHPCLMLLSNSLLKRQTSPHFLLAVQTMHKQETLKTFFSPASLSKKNPQRIKPSSL